MKISHLLIALTLITFSCQKKKTKIEIGHIDETLEVQFERFDQDFYNVKAVGFEAGKAMLAQKYGEFFPIYNQGVIKIGAADDPGYNAYATRWLTDTIFLEVYDSVQSHFPDMTEYEAKLTSAFQRYNALFPEAVIPKFYTHISGFNEPVVVADSLISMSLENYLGEGHVFYRNLGTYDYMLPSKNASNLSIDCMKAWLIAEFGFDAARTSLLNTIINEGKLLFLQRLTMPEVPSHELIGLSQHNYMWCEKNEEVVWRYMIEQQHLFSNHHITITKYIQNGPFFNFFGSGTSPMVGKYVGWQIVKHFMVNNPDVTVEELLKITDGQEILEASGYKP